MWTFRRIVILLGALLLCLCVYSVYALFLSGVDGVPPLETAKLPAEDNQEHDFEDPGEAVRKLEKGFGTGCEEGRRPLKLWLPDKGIAFAAGDFQILDDGRVRLEPFSAAIFHKTKSPTGFPEISTVQCANAYLTLNPPAVLLSDLHKSEIIAVEMFGSALHRIKITNNHGTETKADDIWVYVDNGSLVYEKRTNKITTDGNVLLRDMRTMPPTEVRGSGLDLFLAAEPKPGAPPKPKAAGPQNDTGAVEKIHIRSDVHMHFWVDARAGFLGGTPNTKNAPPIKADGPGVDKKTPPNKAHIYIQTRGQFDYDLTKEYAWFEGPTPKEGAPEAQSPHQDQVHVTRSQLIEGQERVDQLLCDRLDLQFRKSADKPGDQGGAEGDKEIKTAKAVRRGVKDVVLVIAGESIEAFGSEMFYRAEEDHDGPLTIIKGDKDRPMRAIKSGHKIVCPELHLHAANKAGEGQRAWANGPGQIWLLDTKSTAKEPSYPTEIIWRDELTVDRAKEGLEVFDLMKLHGDASFIDKLEDSKTQELHGEKIFVWILQVQESANQPQASNNSKQELRRVFAQEGVHGKTPDFIIRRANFLTMSFLPDLTPKAKLPNAEPLVNVVNKPSDKPNAPAAPGMQLEIRPAVDRKDSAKDEKKSEPPIEMEGNEMTFEIATLGQKKHLREMIGKGNVLVVQPGEKPGEKKFDIRGQLLTIKEAGLDTHVMTVHAADKDQVARVQMGDIILWGPVVVIDQARNIVNVDGRGAMRMPRNKNLDGGKLDKDKPNPYVVVHWNKNMTFDGRNAYFFGGAQAFQEAPAYSLLKCDDMSVKLDKFVSLKEGQKQNQNAKIDRIYCNRTVFIEDSKVSEKKELVQQTRIEGTQMETLDDGPTRIWGQGQFRNLAKGNANQSFGPAPAKTDNGDKPWKLTCVYFTGQLLTYVRGNSRTTKFFGSNSGIVVHQFPTGKIDASMDINVIPKDGFYLRCDFLEVTTKEESGKTTQQMIAQGGNVQFKTDQYIGAANKITFNEETDIIVLEASDGNIVRLVKNVPGQAPQQFNAPRVLYNRRTGDAEMKLRSGSQ